MKQVVFIGGMDKLDLLIYAANIIKGVIEPEKQILIADLTTAQKSRYIVPSVEKDAREFDKKYITTYQKVDIAVGYDDYYDVIENIIKAKPELKEYEYLFIDTDRADVVSQICTNLSEDDLVYFTTTFDIYSLEKGVEVLSAFRSTLPIHKIFFTKKLTSKHASYILYLTQNLQLNHRGETIAFPYDNGDSSIIYENQRARRLNLRPFSNQFKSSLEKLCEHITNYSYTGVRKYMKILEKNG